MINPFFILVLIIIVAILFLLTFHVFRDVRGSRRNRELNCYACGVHAQLWPIHHSKGGTYLYCQDCKKKHRTIEKVFGAVGFVLVIFLSMVIFFTKN